MALKTRERQKYEKQISEVSQELEAMRLSVAKLLEENEKLPESERIDRHEFELVSMNSTNFFKTCFKLLLCKKDVEEQQRRITAGTEKEEDLRLELKVS